MARAVTQTAEMWFTIMWLLDDNPSRCAFRTLSALHLKIGKQARLTVDRKVRHPPGRLCRPEFLRRMAFWTPMAGEIKIVPPPCIPGATTAMRDAAMKRFAEVQNSPFVKRITLNGRTLLQFNSGTPFPHRRHYIMHDRRWITFWEACNL